VGSALKSYQPSIDGKWMGPASRRARTVTIDSVSGLRDRSSADKQSGIGREFEDCGVVECPNLKTVDWSAGRP
jgi:hypothetical protein